ncbi:DUF2530 domain-containing protein [Glaciihabitans sp. INWT7]|uniref:DUF2530 domain-containing protein n=1 Tax=Glaciihabitans sp. INWT7 TaxID=2596912 RepID=UPI0016233C12|nr:DUF2530 domain-containing protein [Glaciihabitans sp. INWT7]QNE47777.1 DUF2530 domain-containing protein [Glaciihabitans sp. INWT7]
MRLFLKDSERRPDPVPVKTDDRRPLLVGLAVWVIAAIIVLLFLRPLSDSGNGPILWTCAVGILLGLAGLIYAAKRPK